MREKLETLSLAQLREFGKAQGFRCSAMRKAELIDLLVEAAEKKPEMKPQEVHSAAAVPVEKIEEVREARTVHRPGRPQTGRGNRQETGTETVQKTGEKRGRKPGAVKTEPAKTEPAKTEPARTGRPVKTENVKPENAMRGRPAKSANAKAEPVNPGLGINELPKAAPVRTETARSEPETGKNAKPETAKTGPVRTETVKTETVRPEAAKTETAGPEAAGAETVSAVSEKTGTARQARTRLRSLKAEPEKKTEAGAGTASPVTAVPHTAESAAAKETVNRAVKSALDAIARDEIPLDQRTRRPIVSLESGEQAPEILAVDSGNEANGILEIMQEGYGFIRCENFLPGEHDVYVAPGMIRRFNLKTGDIIRGHRRVKTASEKFASLLYVTSVNGYPTIEAERRPAFENLTPVFPNERIRLENGDNSPLALRVIDLLAPIGKGQRGMIVSPPKAGKTTLLKAVARAVKRDPRTHLIILLIDERPEEVTDIKEEVTGENVEVIYSTFDELPERHKRVSEMVIERAKRLVEYGRDVTILLDSITRLARAYNLVVPPSGRTLSGGLDPAALHMPKRFFGAARNMREGGSLTILATALIETGSRMDDVIYEEFKGTGNMELVLDRKLSEKRIFPALDILKSGTRRDDLLLTKEELHAVSQVRSNFGSLKPEESASAVLDLFARTRNNREFIESVEKIRYF